MAFVHLHNHSDYSLLDGAIKVEELIKRVKEYQMPAAALTDHGNMFGSVTFYRKARDSGVKPILGIETYLSAEDELSFEGGSPLLFHLVLLVKNNRGYHNLMKLSSKAYLEGFYYKPRITRKWLKDHREGLICLSACAKGEVAHLLAENNPDSARDAARFYRELFGEDFYLEVQNHGLEIEDKVRPGILQLSEDLKIKAVATNDCHYLKREHAKSHDTLLCIQTGSNLDDEKRLRYNTSELYVKSEAEMREVFSDYPQALDNTMEVADKCGLLLDFNQMHLPKFPIPEDSSARTTSGYLARVVGQAAKNKFGGPLPAEIEERLNFELKIIQDMGFSGYFLIVRDFTDFARSRKIAVGPGRGSAAGSLVSYCLGITNIDPLKYDLLFERFLNPERVTMPDIDIDFADDRREEVIRYVKEKYGEDNVTQIITFGKMLARGVVRDVGRVMAIPYGEVDRLAKKIPHMPGMTLERALNESAELKEEIEANPSYKEMIERCLILEGLIRHPGTHAAGVVIAPDELTRYTPLFKSTEGDITSQYDMGCLEAIGLLKMDFLGLKTLTVIESTLELLRKRGIEINIDDIPLDDEETFRLFQEGRTVGVFQFESSGMRDNLVKLKPERLEDLIAMNALYRPGPMQFIDDFIRRKHGKESIKYPHPRLKSILEETYGIIVYQEQVQRIAHDFAGFSMGKADIVRRAMGKKKKEVMESMKSEFVQGAVANGIEEKTAEEIYFLIEKFAQYGFNKSHSTGYAWLAYQTAYLKAHYPAEFMAATMTSEMGRDSSRFIVLVDECRKLGVEALPPDVNESGRSFSVTGGGIRFGLKAVKNVGEGPVESILSAREREGRFTSIYQFIEEVDQRSVNRKALESLIQAGALDSLEPNRARLFASIDSIISYGNAVSDERQRGQFSIFDTGGSAETVFPKPELAEVEPWSRAEKFSREKEMLGYYISGHPLEKFRVEVEGFSSPPIEKLDQAPDGAKVRLCGIITSIRQQVTRKGGVMLIVNLEDFTGSAEILSFPKEDDNEYRKIVTPDAMVVLNGRVSTKEDEPVKIMADSFIPLDKARETLTKSVQVTIDSEVFTSERLNRLEAVVKAHPGKAWLMFIVQSKGRTLRLKSKKYAVSPDDRLLNDLYDLAGRENVRLGY